VYKNKIISAIIPAQDEERSIGKVVAELCALRNHSGASLFDHVIVCDNGSTDNTAQVAQLAGAQTVFEPQPGYGIACLTALAAMPASDVIVFIDGDHSFYAEQSLSLIDEICQGTELAIGSRALGNTQSGALTIPQLFGNWLAVKLIGWIWHVSITDLGPFRAISVDALKQINMQDIRFGWTVEMQVKAIQRKLKIKELPVDTRPRIGVSKISGTVRGVIGAALGIFGTIIKLWRLERKTKKSAQE